MHVNISVHMCVQYMYVGGVCVCLCACDANVCVHDGTTIFHIKLKLFRISHTTIMINLAILQYYILLVVFLLDSMSLG